VTDFLHGGTMVASLGIALFFLRYWRTTGDRLFLAFAFAFTVFAANRVLLAVLDEESSARTWVYLVRALTFLLIAAAVLDKNYGRSRSRRRPPALE
jgi:hypothetical protein